MKDWVLPLIGLALILVLAGGCASAASTPTSTKSPTLTPTQTPTSIMPTATTPIERPGEVQDVAFSELFANPDRYNGRDIVLTGFYFNGFEITVLSEELEFTGSAEGRLWPRGQMVWIADNLIPREVYDQLYQQELIGPIERYGKLRIKGRFDYGERYGHLGSFSAQIVPLEVELLPWSPPPKQQTTTPTPVPIAGPGNLRMSGVYGRLGFNLDSFVERPVRDGPWSARVSGREAPRAVGC